MQPPRATSPFPQLRIDSGALNSSGPSPHSAQLTPSDDTHKRLSVTSSDGGASSAGITPPASPGFPPPPEQDEKRRAQNSMAKLQRFLGEQVPAELLLHPVQSNSSATSSHSPASPPATPATPSVPPPVDTATNLRARAKRRLSLELSSLAAFSLTSRLGSSNGRSTPTQGQGGRSSPLPHASPASFNRSLSPPLSDSAASSPAFAAHHRAGRHVPASLSISSTASASIYSMSTSGHGHGHDELIVSGGGGSELGNDEQDHVVFSPNATMMVTGSGSDEIIEPELSPLSPPPRVPPKSPRSLSSERSTPPTPLPSTPIYESHSLRLPKKATIGTGTQIQPLDLHHQSGGHALPLPHTLPFAMLSHEARTRRRDKEIKEQEKNEKKERERKEKEFEKEMKAREKEIKRSRSGTVGSRTPAPPPQPPPPSGQTKSLGRSTTPVVDRSKLSLDVPSGKLSLDIGGMSRSPTASSSDSGHVQGSGKQTPAVSSTYYVQTLGILRLYCLRAGPGGIRGLLRKKSFDAWGGRGGSLSGPSSLFSSGVLAVLLTYSATQSSHRSHYSNTKSQAHSHPSHPHPPPHPNPPLPTTPRPRDPSSYPDPPHPPRLRPSTFNEPTRAGPSDEQSRRLSSWVVGLRRFRRYRSARIRRRRCARR